MKFYWDMFIRTLFSPLKHKEKMAYLEYYDQVSVFELF